MTEKIVLSLDIVFIVWFFTGKKKKKKKGPDPEELEQQKDHRVTILPIILFFHAHMMLHVASGNCACKEPTETLD